MESNHNYYTKHESRNDDPRVYRHRQQPGRFGQHGDAAVYESHGEYQQHRNYRRFSNEHNEYVYNWIQSSRVENPPYPVRNQCLSMPATPSSISSSATAFIESPRKCNWKLIIDPFLSHATTKVYRYDGVVSNDSSCVELIVQDPRMYKSKTVKLPIKLPVPKFKVCELNILTQFLTTAPTYPTY